MCYTCNETYAPIVGTSMISILKNLAVNGVHFYILCDTFSQETKDKFSQIEKEYSCKIDCIDISDKMAKLLNTVLAQELGMVRNGQISYMFARLFMGSAIPEDVEKVIYIDADTIVQGNLTELYAVPLEKDKVLAAVRDIWPVNYNKVIGFVPKDLYFNSGLMLVNLHRWRQESIENHIMQHIKSLKHYYALHDQDIINICLQGRIQTHPVKYNMQYILRQYSPADIYYFSGKDEKSYYTTAEIEAAKLMLEIIHYTSGYFDRPWVRPYACQDARIWQKYFEMSPWREHNPFYQERNIKYFIKKLLSPFIGRIWLKRFRTRCWCINEHLYQKRVKSNE